MQIVKKTPENLVLKMNENIALANAIRRSVEEVWVLAVEEVEFFKNDSALYDEYLAHRIGLIPLKTDSKLSLKSNISLKLKKSGPGTVYSGDLRGGSKVAYDKIPLTLLEKGQELELIARAKIGNGLEHAKYVPGLCYYRYILEINSNPKIDKIIHSSGGYFKPEKKGNKWICDLPEAVVDEIVKIDKNAVNDSKDMLFFIESWGQMDAGVVLKKAIDALNGNLNKFEKAIK